MANEVMTEFLTVFSLYRAPFFIFSARESTKENSNSNIVKKRTPALTTNLF